MAVPGCHSGLGCRILGMAPSSPPPCAATPQSQSPCVSLATPRCPRPRHGGPISTSRGRAWGPWQTLWGSPSESPSLPIRPKPRSRAVFPANQGVGSMGIPGSMWCPDSYGKSSSPLAGSGGQDRARLGPGKRGVGWEPSPSFLWPYPTLPGDPPTPTSALPKASAPTLPAASWPFWSLWSGYLWGSPRLPSTRPPIMCAALGRGLDGSPPTAQWPWVATRLGGWAEAGGRAFQAQGRQRGPLAPPHPQSSHCQVSKGHCY